MTGMIQFLPNKRLRAILIVSPQGQYLRRAETWVHKLDAQAQGSEKQLFTYSVQNRRAQEIVDVLQSMFSTETGAKGTGGGRNVSPAYQEATLQTASISTSTGQSSGMSGGFHAASGSGGQGGSGSAFGRSPNPAGTGTSPGASVQMAGDGGAEPRVKIVADEAKNAVLIKGMGRALCADRRGGVLRRRRDIFAARTVPDHSRASENPVYLLLGPGSPLSRRFRGDERVKADLVQAEML
jgi:general secretion pathway protein D